MELNRTILMPPGAVLRRMATITCRAMPVAATAALAKGRNGGNSDGGGHG